MTTTKYVPIDSVLYDLSLTLDFKFVNEAAVKEWLYRGFRQLGISAKIEPKVKILEVFQHTTKLPADFIYLNQVAHYLNDECTNDCSPDYSLAQFSPMKLSSSSFATALCADPSITFCPTCLHEFNISSDLTLTTTLPVGLIAVSYLGYPVDEAGLILIPDDETVKEALLHYTLYRYWMSKYQVKEEGADQRLQFHLSMWNTLSKKAYNLNLPDISTLENIKNIRNNLVPKQNEFLNFFTNLSSYAKYDF